MKRRANSSTLPARQKKRGNTAWQAGITHAETTIAYFKISQASFGAAAILLLRADLRTDTAMP